MVAWSKVFQVAMLLLATVVSVPRQKVHSALFLDVFRCTKHCSWGRVFDKTQKRSSFADI